MVSNFYIYIYIYLYLVSSIFAPNNSLAIKIKKKKNKNALFVLMFCPDFHFSPYISFLPHLVPIYKNVIHFGTFHKCLNGKILGERRNY